MSKYSEIIGKLEKADGPSYDGAMNIAIFRALFPDAEWERCVIGRYDCSIDAAIEIATKMMPGWGWLVRDDKKGAFCNISAPDLRGNPFGEWIDGETCFPHWAKTAPLAILLALFKALEAQEQAQ